MKNKKSSNQIAAFYDFYLSFYIFYLYKQTASLRAANY